MCYPSSWIESAIGAASGNPLRHFCPRPTVQADDFRPAWHASELGLNATVSSASGVTPKPLRELRKPGEGRRGGFRTVVAWREKQRGVFLHGFAKNRKANLTPDEQEAFEIVAKHYLGLTSAGLKKLVAAGELIEVEVDHGKKVSE